MKAELTLPQELVDQIAEKVINRLKPVISANGKHEEDTLLDVSGLASYLQCSKQWIYQRTSLKEIPYLKLDGQLRFRKKDIDKWLIAFSIPAIRGGR